MDFDRWSNACGPTPAPRWDSPDRSRYARLSRTVPALLAETHLFSKLRSRRRIVWRDHRVVRRQSPFFAILFRGHIVLTAQVPSQGFKLLAVLQADEVIRRD